MMLRSGPWNLTDLTKVDTNGLKVFSCFAGGGGSSMGYKLAGYEVLGCCEIDQRMIETYIRNLKPKHAYKMCVSKLKSMDLPPELFELDILDGSPPCSSFSIAGSRDKAWGVDKKFREGQAKQVLDDLFFVFIDVAERLKPKIVVAENVKGLTLGNARGYVKMIFDRFEKIGYDCQFFLLNAASMGVPQVRERTFFIARRKDLAFPSLRMSFNESPILVEEAFKGLPDDSKELKDGKVLANWKVCPMGGYPKAPSGNTLGYIYKLHPKRPCATLVGQPRLYHWKYFRRLNPMECVRIQSFPDDYKFGTEAAQYVCGMSVPPFMMQRIAYQIYRQSFSNLK